MQHVGMRFLTRPIGRAPLLALTILSAALAAPSAAATGETLAAVEARGLLNCGVTRSGVGLSETDAMGQWQGFFPDMCRAIAAAILDDAEAVDWVEVDLGTRFDALNGGAFDVLIGNTTWTMRRDTDLRLGFTNTLLYDGQGFLGHADLGAERLADLEDATVCVHDNTTTIANLRELVRTRFPQLEILTFQSDVTGFDAFFARQCDLLTQDRSALIAQRASRGTAPENYILLEDVISREPLGPAVREQDVHWFDLVQWVTYALIIAEEHGVTRDRLDDPDLLAVPEVARLLGAEGDTGAMLGLSSDWARRALAAVGNYGEIYDRHLGSGSPLQVPRGINDLWQRGGQIYAPPMR